MVSDKAYLQASSFHSGLVTVSGDVESLSVLVLPKFWKPDTHASGSRRVLKWASEQSQRRLVLYENETVTLVLEARDADHLKARRDLLRRLLELCKEDKESLPFLSEGAWASGGVDEQVTADEVDIEKPLLALLTLMSKTGAQEGAHQTHIVANDMLLPLTHKRFVTELGRTLSSLRRGYVPRQEILGVIRGRVVARSAAITEESGLPSLLCNYDEFTEGTALIRVLVAALEQVCSGTWVSRFWPESFLGRPLQNEATMLRRHLKSIPALSKAQAMATARRVRFNRMTRVLEPAFRLAVDVLKGASSLFARTGRSEHDGWLWSVDMSQVWERIIVLAFESAQRGDDWVVHFDMNAARKAFFSNEKSHKTPPPRTIKPPWTALGGNRRPDILLRSQERCWILDAKYKQVVKAQAFYEPSREDGFQMFVYAHMTLKDGKTPWVNQLGLVYPCAEQPLEASESSYKQRAYEIGGIWTVDVKPSLHQILLPFPSFDDVGEGWKGWQGYLSRAGEHLAKRLDPNP